MKKIIKAYINRAKYRAKVYSSFANHIILPKKKQKLVDDFHKLFYDSNLMGKTWNDSYFLGVGINKCPFDFFIYQEILFDVKPDIIIETGTKFGGSAYYLAVLCDELKKGKIITIDTVDQKNKPTHKRIKYIIGSSTNDEKVKEIKKYIKTNDKVMVILDSDHSMGHVYGELKIYGDLVTKNSYLIVEDTNVNGNPVNLEHGPGPMEALRKFIGEDKRFISDKSREKFYFTFNPNGYLKKIK